MRRTARRQLPRRPTSSLVGPPGPGHSRRQVSVLTATPGTDPTAREPGATPRPETAFESLRRNALRPETVAPTAAPRPNAAFASSRIDPLNREPEATTGSGTALGLPGRNALHRETAAPAAARAPRVAIAPSRTDPSNREPEAPPRPGTARELPGRNALHVRPQLQQRRGRQVWLLHLPVLIPRTVSRNHRPGQARLLNCPDAMPCTVRPSLRLPNLARMRHLHLPVQIP
jgi:hypothetical protein